jgi:hypothetical protein
MYKLTVILKQKHGLSFAETLNRSRTGDHTAADLQLLKQFEIDVNHPPGAYSLFYIVHHVFHVSLLEPYRESGRVQPPPPPVEMVGALEYEVASILGH